MLRQISTLFVLFGLLLILSCVDTADGKPRRNGNNENRISAEIQTVALATPDPQGLSHNDITVKLKDNDLNKVVFIDLQFDAADFKLMTVKLPQVSADDCKERPEIARWAPQGSKNAPLEMYHRSYGWSPNQSEPWLNCVYDMNEDIGTKGGQQTITLRFTAAKACTKLHVQVDVQFKAAGS